MSPSTSTPAPFPLTRYFVATGVITAVVVGAGLATISAHELREDLLKEREDFAVLIAQNLNRQVHERFIYPTIARDGGIDLDGPHLNELDAVVHSGIAEFGIHTVYFFDPEGRIEYSTNLEHRGFNVGNNPHFRRAAAGEPASTLVARDSPLDVGGRSGKVPLLETYVPVHPLDDQGRPGEGIRGVIEIYQDATGLLADTRRATARTVGISTLGILTLMLALWLWIRKAEQTIEERSHELVEANASLAALSADLERQVEDRTRRLLQAETLASVGTLSAGVAHEINNPVAAIASCAEGLLRRTRGSESLKAHPDFGDFPEYLEIIRSESFRVKDITRNLLDFSRRGSSARREPVDLASLLRGTERLLSHRLTNEDKRLVMDLPEEPAVVRGDGASLRQLVLNLTVNALDAARSRVSWQLTPEGGGFVLICSDDGPGFGPVDLERALEPFYTQKPTGQGTGLGLSLAYGIVRHHGGRIELGNGKEGGARVVVHLPYDPPSAEEPIAEEPVAEEPIAEETSP